MRCKRFSVGLTLLFVLAAAGAAPAENVLTAVPHNALAVVVVNNVEGTQAKIVKLGEKLGVPLGELLKQGPVNLDSLKLDKQGSVALAVVPKPEGESTEPGILLVAPTDDYKGLIAPFEPKDAGGEISEIQVEGASLLAAKKGNFALLSTSSDRAVLEAALKSPGNVVMLLAGISDWSKSQDAYAAALPSGIKVVQQQLLFGIEQMKGVLEGAGEEARAALAGMELYENLFKAMDKELDVAAAGIRLQESGDIHVAGIALPVSGSRMEKLLAAAAPAVSDPLAGLPAGPFVFAGGGVLPEGWMEPLLKISMEMIKGYPGGENYTEEDIQKLKELTAQSFRSMRSMGMLMKAAKTDEPLYSNLVLTMQVKNADEYLSQYKKTMEEMAALGKERKNSLFSAYQVEETKIGEHPGLMVRMDMAPFLGPQPPEAKQMMQWMLGDPNKFDVYLAAADKTTIVGAYISKATAQAALAAAQNPENQLAQEKGILAVKKQLPEGAHAIGYWSVRGSFEFARNMLSKIAPDAPAEVPVFPETNPVGFALKFTPAAVETRLVVPSDVIDAAARMARGLETSAE